MSLHREKNMRASSQDEEDVNQAIQLSCHSVHVKVVMAEADMSGSCIYDTHIYICILYMYNYIYIISLYIIYYIYISLYVTITYLNICSYIVVPRRDQVFD